MATQIPVQTLPDFGAHFATGGITWTPADAAGMFFNNTGKEVLLARSLTGAVGARTAVVEGDPSDDSGRDGSKTLTCPAAGDYSLAGPFKASNFNAGVSGQTQVTIATATLFELAVVRFGRG
jgi:hypothetical protein